jgi:hypothetical protein
MRRSYVCWRFAAFKVTIPAITVTLLASNGNGLNGAIVHSGGWKSFGTTASDGTARMVLALGTYNFQISRLISA